MNRTRTHLELDALGRALRLLADDALDNAVSDADLAESVRATLAHRGALVEAALTGTRPRNADTCDVMRDDVAALDNAFARSLG